MKPPFPLRKPPLLFTPHKLERFCTAYIITSPNLAFMPSLDVS